jgi:hypothetical protein
MMKKYKLTYYEWGKLKTKKYNTKDEAYQKARNSDVYVNDKQVFRGYTY